MSQLDTDKTIDELFGKLGSGLEGVFESLSAKIKAKLDAVAESGDSTAVALALVQEIARVRMYSEAVLRSAESNATALDSESPLTRFLSRDTLSDEDVKEVLQGLRLRKLSQGKIAQAIEVDQPYISRVLKNYRSLTPDQKTKLLDFLRAKLTNPPGKE